ncbi:NEQ119 [Nanoarchaeum equitans Kin4-M]|uniref:NEQ119 n=1 Tax=Nanoarchaeum equitans (strain Kin4-M) TaxID=228908 RepID=Q74N95_NANEQ|nr:NEQ119 [Nanoarchaeum equitans Kin4-M]
MPAIAILSGKGGVGKTTISVNLAKVLSTKFRTLLIDGNLTTPNVAIFLGLNPLYTLNDVLRGDINVSEAIVKKDNLYVLPASIRLKDLQGINPEKIKDVIESLKEHYDYIIIDTAPGLGREMRYSILGADEAIAITTTDASSLVDTTKAMALAEQKGISIKGAIINMYDGSVNPSTIEDFLETSILGIIPYDPTIKRYTMKNQTIENKKTKGAIAIKRIAERLTNEKFVYSESFIDKLLSFLKR